LQEIKEAWGDYSARLGAEMGASFGPEWTKLHGDGKSSVGGTMRSYTMRYKDGTAHVKVCYTPPSQKGKPVQLTLCDQVVVEPVPQKGVDQVAAQNKAVKTAMYTGMKNAVKIWSVSLTNLGRVMPETRSPRQGHGWQMCLFVRIAYLSHVEIIRCSSDFS
jgi:hypothetical protein